MGPWSHMEPNGSIPGPRIDHVHEMIRWFDRWLRDADNGIDREPPIVVFARQTTRPEPDLDAYEAPPMVPCPGGWTSWSKPRRGSSTTSSTARAPARSAAPSYASRSGSGLVVCRANTTIGGSRSMPLSASRSHRSNQRIISWTWSIRGPGIEPFGSSGAPTPISSRFGTSR